jgi:hypothetical protein
MIVDYSGFLQQDLNCVLFLKEEVAIKLFILALHGIEILVQRAIRLGIFPCRNI